MIDTSVWADHFRSADSHLMFLWSQDAILQHPMVTGELAMGNLPNWDAAIASLGQLAQAERLDEGRVISFVKKHQLMGCGVGFIDAHILASVACQPGVFLWTRDKRLRAQAEHLGVAHESD